MTRPDHPARIREAEERRVEGERNRRARAELKAKVLERCRKDPELSSGTIGAAFGVNGTLVQEWRKEAGLVPTPVRVGPCGNRFKGAIRKMRRASR